MRYFIDQGGNYYETLTDDFEILAGHTEVGKRPDADSVWSGSSWGARTLTLDEVKAREVEQLERQGEARVERLVERKLVQVVIGLADGQTGTPGYQAALADVRKVRDVLEIVKQGRASITAATTKTAARAVVPGIVWP